MVVRGLHGSRDGKRGHKVLSLGKSSMTSRRRRCFAKGDVGETKKPEPQTKKSPYVFPYSQVFQLHQLEHIVAICPSARDLTVHTSELKLSAIKLETGHFVLHCRVIGVLDGRNVL